ncbi:hypothetical protein C5L38_33840 (plasmid) [Streptomyces sp. WAC00288]|nr:hypothetical protein C5L38_33840 [Streptomyces sp. WAC00288]
MGPATHYGAVMSEPFAQGEDHPACGICPSKRLPREEFVVYSRPSWECPFDPADGLRYTLKDRTPACVHPHKLGVEPDRIAPPPREPVVEAEATPVRRGGWRSLFRAR